MAHNSSINPGVTDPTDPIRLETAGGDAIVLEGDDATDEGAGDRQQEPVRVLIADDHPFVREGLKVVLKQQDFSICAEAPDSNAAVRAALAVRPQVCVLGVHMPGSGIRAASRITKALPQTAVVMVGAYDDESELLDSLRAGAVGFLPRNDRPEALPAMIGAALRGESAIPRRLVTVVLNALLNGRSSTVALPSGASVKLTPREWEVLELLSDELSTQDIASRLHLSPVTVRRHIATVIKKLKVSDRPAALSLFRDHAQAASQ